MATFEKRESVTRIPTEITLIEVQVLDSLPTEEYPEGVQLLNFRLVISDENGKPMDGEAGDLSDHLDEKTYDDFIKAIEKFRKKSEDEILP